MANPFETDWKAPSKPKRPYGFLLIIRTLAIAVTDPRMTEGMKDCLTLLADFCDQKGSCFPSQRTIANRLGCSRQAVQKQLRKVEALGYFTSRRKFHTHGGESTKLYQLNLETGRTGTCPANTKPDKGVQPTKACTPSNPQDLAPGCNTQGVARRNQIKEINRKIDTSGISKQQKWQVKRAREATSRVFARMQDGRSKEEFMQLLATTTPEELDELVRQELNQPQKP